MGERRLKPSARYEGDGGGLLMLKYVSHVKINKYGSYKSLWCVET
jgi:uncharacterized membrane protein